MTIWVRLNGRPTEMSLSALKPPLSGDCEHGDTAWYEPFMQSTATAVAYRAARPVRLLAQPTVVLIGNVFTDMTRLVRRAAEELSDPGLVSRAASVVPTSPCGHAGRNAAPGSPVAFRTCGRRRRTPTNASPTTRRWTRRAPASDFAGHPDKLRAHLFGLARVYRVDDDLLAQWDPTFSELGFADAVAAARWLAVRGRSDEAWAAIESRLPRWYPMAWCQLAPVELLVDRTLAPLMTPQRCAQVLATPRGPEAAAR